MPFDPTSASRAVLIEISGIMPNGEHNVVHAKIVRPKAFILIKAFAIDERVKERDA